VGNNATPQELSGNNFVENGSYGLFNESNLLHLVAATVDARDNWWGDASGPYHATQNPLGLGDQVSDHITFGPWLTVPLAAQLADFSVSAEGKHLLVTWQTVSELENLGFNLYRNTSHVGADIMLNSELIPSQAPGSGQGASYSWQDDEVSADTTYYYWLADVDINGIETLHGPISITYQGPSAVTIAQMKASHAAGRLTKLVSAAGVMLLLLCVARARYAKER
jgi:hypothetical protein